MVFAFILNYFYLTNYALTFAPLGDPKWLENLSKRGNEFTFGLKFTFTLMLLLVYPYHVKRQSKVDVTRRGGKNLYLLNIHTLKASYLSSLTMSKGVQRLIWLVRRGNESYLNTSIVGRMNESHLKLVNDSH